MTSANPRARHHVLGIVALSLFAALFTRLWYLQVLTTEEATDAVDSANIITVIEEAPRGRILDRSGKVLVQNRKTIQVQVDFQDYQDLERPERTELLRRLAGEINVDQVLQVAGQRAPDDPGPRPDEPVEETTTTEAGDEEPGAGDETTTTSTTTTVPLLAEDPDDASALDEPTTATTVPEGGPFVELPPPAGVATGQTNPDGSVRTQKPAPEEVTVEVLEGRINSDRYSKFKPVPVASGISEELELYITEHPERFPTVSVERVTVRDYRYGALLAHVLGYVGSITDEEGDQEIVDNEEEKPYETDDDIGKAGIEREMEHDLRGTPGETVYEVDARRRPIREITELRREPRPGRDVYLTVDINMQYLMEKGLAAEVERRRGVVDPGCFQPGGCDPKGAASIAVDPRNGQVLAIASYPTYDPNLFVGGISEEDYDAIANRNRGDEHNFPLLNRAIAGQYAAGSTFKLFSAYAGLANGMITPEYVYNDTGTYLYDPNCNVDNPENNCSATNAGAAGTGAVDLREALTLSSDTYFYKIGDDSWRAKDRIGREAMQTSMKAWGLGEPTGIDLPGEATGRIPTPDWLMDFSLEINGDNDLGREAGTWTAGTSGNTMVGQGDVLVTPLQLAQGYATLANGGTVWEPQLVLQVSDYGVATNAGAAGTGAVDLREALTLSSDTYFYKIGDDSWRAKDR
ncbi:MAG TPA: penicillin-binding transpeptidase domain-containing protein, partial [Iamia sp.]|nr:penicillin-binding transpeptidase domain-containing protein [Iamia sp.]